MADYSTRDTKRIKTSGDMQLTAASDISIIPSSDLNATVGGNINLTSSGSMTFTDPNRSATLSQIVNETVHAEYVMVGSVAASGNGRKLDEFEQTFVGTSADDYLEIDINFLVQDTSGSDPCNISFDLQFNTNDAGYATQVSIPLLLNGVTATFSAPLSYHATVSLGTNTIATRLLLQDTGQGEVLNAASSFRLRHVTKYHPFTEYVGGTWSTV